MPAAPSPLSENTGLAFIGETEWPPAVVSAKRAGTLALARNPAGRPNSDILRSFIGRSGRRLREHWQIDFPAHYHEQESALHEKPFAILAGKVAARTEDWWINPHAQPLLRQALARLDRFLAIAIDAPEPAWMWYETNHLPDASLLVVARDEDFAHAMVQSAAFVSWWHTHFRKESPTMVIESFPFPWPLATPLGSLSKEQQEVRSSAARAALAGDAEQLNAAVAAAYGWNRSLDEAGTLDRLRHLHAQRGGFPA